MKFRVDIELDMYGEPNPKDVAAALAKELEFYSVESIEPFNAEGDHYTYGRLMNLSVYVIPEPDYELTK